jgi:trehalose 2-sulfotransferase
VAVSYLICATPRSGSTLLCETLARTGVAGRPLEFFEAVPATGVPRRPIDYLEGLDDPDAVALVAGAPPREPPPYSDLRGIERYADHLERVRRWGTTANGVFGAKIMWRQLVDLAVQTGARGPAGALRSLFGEPRCVWVRRADTVRQAVSLWRAMQTQSWRAETEASPVAGTEPRYSFAALRHLVGQLSADDAAWRDCFAAAGSGVLMVTYEELASDLGGIVARTLSHIGVPAPNGAALPRMRRQADELSDAWVEAYARDAARELAKSDRI